MRERDEDALALAARTADGFMERHLAPEAFDRELTDEQDDPRLNERDLAREPRRAVRDLRRARFAVARARRGLAWKALRDRGAIRKVILVDTGACEPAPQLRARASAEWKTRGELHATRCLPDDHHAVACFACDDRKRARDESRIGASCARADLRMQTSESAFARAIDHIANVD